MKLAYLWIEKYKNIEKQGFNFSNKYSFKVEMQENRINIETTQLQYDILNDFGIDLKLIIGKNGSGKSGLLEAFMLIQYGMKNKDLKYFMIFENNNEFYIRKNFSAKIKWVDSKYKELEKFHGDIQNIYLNFSMDTFSPIFKKNLITSLDMIYDYEEIVMEKNVLAYPNKKSEKINLNNFYRDLIKMYFRVKKEYNISDKEIEEKILSVFTKDEENFSFKIEKFRLEFDENIYQSFFNNIAYKRLISSILGAINPTFNNLDINKLYKLSVIFLFIGFVEKLPSFDSYFKNNKLKNIIIDFKENLQNFISKKELNKTYLELTTENMMTVGEEFLKLNNIFIDKIREFNLSESINKILFNTFPTLKEVAWYIDYINEHNRIQKKSLDLFLKWNNLDDELIKILLENLPPFVHINVKDKKGREFLDLSFGEKLFNFLIYVMMYFVKFYSNKKKKTITILYDEFDIGMHPEMQRRFIKLLFNIHKVVKKYNPNIDIKYILATHSPLILSDIPSTNVILLKNGKEENKDLNSFGGNIFELYNDTFFLDNSIGKFSEEIIKSISLGMDFIIHLEKKEAFYLRRMFNVWYIGKNLTDEEYEKQDKEFLNNLIDLKKSLKELLQNLDHYNVLIDFIINQPEKIKNIIEMIGESVMKNHLNRRYEIYVQSLKELKERLPKVLLI